MALISFTASNADTPECHLIWFPTQLSIWFGHKIDSFSLLVFYTFYYLILSSLSSPSLPSPHNKAGHFFFLVTTSTECLALISST